MLKTLPCALVVLCCLLAGTRSARAEEPEDGFVINPFEQSDGAGESSEGRYTARISDEPESKFRLSSFPTLPKPALPKIRLLPERKRTPLRGSPPPSTWDKFSGGAKALLVKTKHTLMPWTKNDDRTTRQARMSRATRPASRAPRTSRPRAGSKTLFSSWFGQQEEEKEIRTVNDFLSLPHVPYE